jgi:hypothetical protein
MKPLLMRHRWAIVLAVLQSVIFVAVGVSEHRRNLRYNREHERYEYFGCFRLPHQRLPPESEWSLLDCFPSIDVKVVVLSNFPVLVIWNLIRGLTENHVSDQFRVFYLVYGIGIPVLWFGVGSLIDRRRFKFRDGDKS